MCNLPALRCHTLWFGIMIGSLVDADVLSALCVHRNCVIMADSCMLRSVPYSTTVSSLFYSHQKLTARLHILLSV